MKVGARNQLKARVTAIKRGQVMAQIKLLIPAESVMGSVITVESLEEMGLEGGREGGNRDDPIRRKPNLHNLSGYRARDADPVGTIRAPLEAESAIARRHSSSVSQRRYARRRSAP